VVIFFKILTFSSICLFCEFVCKGSSNSNVCIESKDYFHSISPIARLYQPQAVGFSACLDRLIVCDTWYFVTKIVLTYCEKKNRFSDQEKLLKFEAEDQEFAKFLISLEQFIQTVKGQNNFW
jgi:hypothetical protein